GQMEQAEEIDEVTFDKTQTAQVLQFFFGKTQLAQCVHFGTDLVQVGPQVHSRCAALVTVFDLRSGKVMQHHLHHAELVQVGVEQRSNYHDGAVRARIVSSHHSISSPPPLPGHGTTPARVMVAP